MMHKRHCPLVFTLFVLASTYFLLSPEIYGEKLQVIGWLCRLISITLEIELMVELTSVSDYISEVIKTTEEH